MSLPSVLRAAPALQDLATDNADGLGKVTSPEQTPIFICTLSACNRLFPSRERVMLHRKRDHAGVGAIDDSNIITWN